MWYLIERAVAPGHRYKLFKVKPDGGFVRLEVGIHETKLRLLEDKIVEHLGKTYGAEYARRLVAEINTLRRLTGMVGEFSVVDEESTHGRVTRVVFHRRS